MVPRLLASLRIALDLLQQTPRAIGEPCELLIRRASTPFRMLFAQMTILD